MHLIIVSFSDFLLPVVFLVVTVFAVFFLNNSREEVYEEEILAPDDPRKPFFEFVWDEICEETKCRHTPLTFLNRNEANEWVKIQIEESAHIFFRKRVLPIALGKICEDTEFAMLLLDRMIDEGYIVVHSV